MDNDLISRSQACEMLLKQQQLTPSVVRRVLMQVPTQEAEKNEPLTLDELRQMDKEPVWFVTDYEADRGWHICHGEYQDRFIACDSGDCYDFRTFVEKRIVAYRHKPEGENGNGECPNYGAKMDGGENNE